VKYVILGTSCVTLIVLKMLKFVFMTPNLNEPIAGFDQLLEYAKKGTLSTLIIESSDDAIKTKTLDGIITSWNRGAEKIYGYNEAEIIGKNISLLIPPNQLNELDELLKQISNGLDIPHYETKRIRKDGIIIDASLALSPIKDETGKIIGVATVSRDITGRNQASQYARSLIEASLDPLVTISARGKITDVNEATVNITGIERDKLIGTDFSDYFTEPEKAREGYKQVFEKGFVADYPLTIHHKNGKLTDVLYNASVYKDANGNVLGVFAAARDITAQKQASQYSRSLIEASLDPLVTISIEGKITDVNEASVKVTGIERDKLIGTDFSNYFTEPEKAREGYKNVFEKGFVSDYPLTIHHKSGKLTDVLYNASVYRDDKGNVLGVFAAARDITGQKKYAEELKFKNEELEKAKELAENLSNVKDQFLASMSHEIRTPLNGIIGFTKILLRNGINETQKPQLEAIKTSSDILLVLINDILDLAKIEAGKMTIESTELKLSDLVNSILGSFELRFQEKEIRINKSYDNRIPKILIGDPVRINQILLNLLSNSVKFTKNGGQIGIDVNLLDQDEENIRIELIVSDSGIGIPNDKLDVIFEPFTQSSSDTARKYGGTGLGLSIVKRLVDLMDGTVSVKSKLNEGTVFTITLPLKKTSATEISNEIETRIHADELKRLGKLKILLVEDIPINQFLAQTILHDFGFESDAAENGRIAIELLEKNHYDIILMDLMMPEMNGFEATQYIRKKMNGYKSTIPIIALTADVSKTDVERCREVGMNEYVSKPINETDLLNKIASLVKNTKTTIQEKSIEAVEKKKICNLDYLKSHSPNNPKFLVEMIQMFLSQTPQYLSEMERCLAVGDWNGLHGNAHKIRPSIDFLGLPKEISSSAKLLDEYGATQQNIDLIPNLFLKIKNAFQEAYIELEEELEKLKPEAGKV
jgi:PAS domain S-box-containing protein